MIVNWLLASILIFSFLLFSAEKLSTFSAGGRSSRMHQMYVLVEERCITYSQSPANRNTKGKPLTGIFAVNLIANGKIP